MTDNRHPSINHHGLDRLFHSKARLAIVTALAGSDKGLSFAQLKALCGFTDGNLSSHLQVLEEAGYVSIEKGYGGKRPLTLCRLTHQGRVDFCTYLVVLEDVVTKAKDAAWTKEMKELFAS